METKFVSAYIGDHWATHLVSALMEWYELWAVVEPYLKQMGWLEWVIRWNFEERYLPGLSPKKLNDTREKFELALSRQIPPNVPVYWSVGELLKNEGWPLAVIHAGPDKTHAPDGIQILEAWHHLFLEKPVAQTREELHRIMSIAKHSNHQNQVFRTCYIREFDDPFMWLNRNFETIESIIWPVQKFDFHIAYPEPSKQGLHTSFLSDHLPHELHLISWILEPRLRGLWGEIKHTIMLHDKSATHYHVSGFIEWAEGLRKIHFYLGWGRWLKKWNKQKFEERITLTWDYGSMVIDLNLWKASFDMFDVDSKWHPDKEIWLMNYRGRTAWINGAFFDSIVFKQDFTVRANILNTIKKTTAGTIDLDNSHPGDVVKF